MNLGTSPRAWFDAISWHVRGLFATEDNRKVAFAIRSLAQPAEIEARRGLARELATELDPRLRLDPAAGFRFLPRELLPDLTGVCADGRLIADGPSRDAESTSNKKFFRFGVAEEAQRFALIRIAVDRRLLAIAASYLGAMPVITEADFFCSFPVPGPFTKSQLWHCDDDAGQVLKIFIHCDTVEPADGPFELVAPARSRMVRDAVGYRYAGRRYRVSDETMSRYVRDDEIQPMLGPAGTSFVVDTVRCFHRGSRIVDPNRRRVVAMICFCPPSARTLPLRLAGGHAPLESFASEFTDPMAQAALGRPVARTWI